MNPFSLIWNGLKDGLTYLLELLHGVLEPVFGFDAAWGWAIIALTIVVRIVILPLAIKQTKSMRGMQAIQPKVKAIQEKYKTDRDLMRKDPELYQRRKAEMNEKLMELYKEEGVNPASSCLPLLLQMPVFFALFRVLGVDGLADLRDASFYFFTANVDVAAAAERLETTVTEVANIGLGASISEAGWPGWLLIVAMSGTMFITQRQMMSRNTVEGPAATQQKVMMYVFPVFLAFISSGFPLAVVLYWVTTNIWQGAQQWVIMRSVAHDAPPPATGKGAAKNGPSSPSDGGKPAKGGPSTSATGPDSKASPTSSDRPGKSGKSGRSAGPSDGHLPKRKS